MSTTRKMVSVPGYMRAGKKVKGFKRKYVTTGKKTKEEVTPFRLVNLRDIKTGRIVGTKFRKIKMVKRNKK